MPMERAWHIHAKRMEGRQCGNRLCSFLGLVFSSQNKKPGQWLAGGDVGGLTRKERGKEWSGEVLE